MKDISAALLGLICIIMILIWITAFTLGCVEILWWVFTGDFFHFVSTEAIATF